MDPDNPYRAYDLGLTSDYNRPAGQLQFHNAMFAYGDGFAGHRPPVPHPQFVRNGQQQMPTFADAHATYLLQNKLHAQSQTEAARLAEAAKRHEDHQ